MKLNEIKPNPNNPRVLKDEKFRKLKKSIQDFPKMLELRPIVVDDDGMILGGNMRYRALQEIYGRNGEVPAEWVKRAKDLTEDEKRQFIIKDNAPFGEWDWDALANEWDAELLNEWGVDTPKEWSEEELEEEKGDVPFTEILGEEHNYVVLFFDNSVDWLQAQSIFNIQPRQDFPTNKNGKTNTKMKRVGVGRVINGAEALQNLLNYENKR